MKGTIDTPFGKLSYQLTSGEHVYLCSLDDESFAINNVLYNLGAHLYLTDGVWNLRGYADLFMSRRDDPIGDATPAAVKKMRKELPEIWRSFVTDDMVREATTADLEETRNKMDKEIEETEEELRELKRKRSEINQKLAIMRQLSAANA